MLPAVNQSDPSLRLYDDVHGRYFDFREFGGLGREFMSNLAHAFVKYSSTVALGTAQSAFSVIINFLRWIDENQQQLSELVGTLRTDYRKSQSRNWEDTIALWRADVIGAEKLSQSGRYNRIQTLNAFVRRLSVSGLIPKLFLVGAPPPFRTSRPTKTLVEVPYEDSTHGVIEILDKALSGTAESGIELQIKRDFLKTLVNETGKIVGTAEEQAKSLMKINANRLKAIRRCAERDFIKWVSFWNDGQRALKECDMSYEEVARLVDAKPCAKWSSLFPRNDSALTLSRLLTYFAGHPQHRGRMRGHAHGVFKGGITKLISRLGGPETLQAYLLPHIDLAHATIILVLCDTGAKPEHSPRNASRIQKTRDIK